MLAGVAGQQFDFILMGCIWAVAMGLAAGNYACSLVHRLPRGRLLLDKTPYCGNCGTLLKVKDLFPVISAVLLRHKCRYCGQPFPVSHTWTELLVALLFVLTYLQYNFAEQYVLVVGIGVFLITLAAIEMNENMVMTSVLMVVLVFGMIFRTLQDGSIFGFVEAGLYGLMLGVLLNFRKIKKVGHIYVPPTIAFLLSAGGICVGKANLPTFLVLFAGLWLVCFLLNGFKEPVRLTVPFGFAVMWPVLYPAFSTLP
ncbi:MAG: prepilin peptidase [Alphaproteobacteria bacterium]